MKIEIINPIKPFCRGFYLRKNMEDMGIWYFGGYIYRDREGVWWSHNGFVNGMSAGWSTIRSKFNKWFKILLRIFRV